MPELPEVETTVRGLERVLRGRRISRVEARRADLRYAFPKDLGQRLTGARVTGLGRRALQAELDRYREVVAVASGKRLSPEASTDGA